MHTGEARQSRVELNSFLGKLARREFNKNMFELE